MRETNPGMVAGVVVTDAAKRCANIINGYLAFTPYDELRDKWVAIRLQDGGSDGTLYDTKQDAVRFQSDEFRCMYVSYRNIGNGISEHEAQRFLDYNRMAYDAGFRLPDPDDKKGGRDLIQSTTDYDNWRQAYGRKLFAEIEQILRREI